MLTKITLHYSVHMRTTGEKVRVSDEAERSIGFIFSYKIIVRVRDSQGPTRGAGGGSNALERHFWFKRRNSKWSFTNEPEVRFMF